MKDLGEIMKQAQEMQAKMAEMQSGMDDMEVTGQSGGGMVQVTLNGRGDMKKVSVDPGLFSEDDKEVVEDLIVAAHNDAKSRVEQAAADKMKEITGGMGLPGGMDLSNFKMPF